MPKMDKKERSLGTWWKGNSSSEWRCDRRGFEA